MNIPEDLCVCCPNCGKPLNLNFRTCDWIEYCSEPIEVVCPKCHKTTEFKCCIKVFYKEKDQ